MVIFEKSFHLRNNGSCKDRFVDLIGERTSKKRLFSFFSKMPLKYSISFTYRRCVIRIPIYPNWKMIK